MSPKVIVISLDGATASFANSYLNNGVLDPTIGLGLLKSKGVTATGNQTITPSLTAPSHIAIATGSTAAKNDINANSFHLVASPFTQNISGFAAPIGGYEYAGIDGAAHDSEHDTAEPLWLNLRAAGKKVVAATFPGADGIDIRLVPNDPNSPILQPKEERTVDYTVPFGAFGGVGAQGFNLTQTDFDAAPQTTITQLQAAGQTFFSPVLQTKTALNSFTVSNVNFNIQVAALDTSNDNQINYDTLAIFDAAQGIKPGPFNLPSTGPAYIKASDKTSQPFLLENTPNKVGTSFYVTNLAPDLSTVRIARYSANFIPNPGDNNPAVKANVDDINNNIGFWLPQPDFRIPQKASPGFADFPDVELEAIYADQVKTFTDYQTKLALRAIDRNPDADLVMTYFEQPDGSKHQFLLTDPRQATNPADPNSIGAGQDAAKVARYQSYVQTAYQTANEAVQKIIDAVGTDSNGVPNSNIIVVSDHGFAPFHTSVSMNNILKNAGFDSNKVRAIISGPAVNIYINLKGREPNGTVEPAEYVQLQKQVIDTLNSVIDSNATYTLGAAKPVFDKVYNRPIPANPTVADIIKAQSEFIGQDSGDVFALLEVGYNFDGFQNSVRRQDDAIATGDPVFSVPTFYGAHGYDPTLPEMKAIFYAAGPDIDKVNVGEVRNIDIAPTINNLLGVESAETVQGMPIKIKAADGNNSGLGSDTLIANNNETLRGNEGNDFLFAVGSQGNNQLDGGEGNDELTVVEGQNNQLDGGAGHDKLTVIEGQNNQLKGGIGDDILKDSSGVGGNNKLYGGDGSDTLYGGVNTQLFGDADDDLLYGGVGGSTLTGGAGSDRFWLATAAFPTTAHTVTDFKTGEDKLAIGGLPEVTNFSSLQLEQEGNNTVVSAANRKLATLLNVQKNTLAASDFIINQTEIEADSDRDGILDSIENGARNNGDGNNDGIRDSQQANVVSLPKAKGSPTNPNDFLTLAAPKSTKLSNVKVQELADLPTAAQTEYTEQVTQKQVNSDIGFLDFQLEGQAAGASTTATLFLPSGNSANTYWMYGSEPGNATPHWFEFGFDGAAGTGASFVDSDKDGKTDRVVLHFVDGERGDRDLTKNGIVTNSGTPGVAANATGKLTPTAQKIFVTEGTAGFANYQFAVTQNEASFSNELGVFVVDDDNGTVNGIAPGADGYVKAALGKAQTIFSVLPDNLLGEKPTRQVSLPADQRLMFYLVQNGTTEQVLSGTTNTPNVFFGLSSANDDNFDHLQVVDAGNGVFKLGWEDMSGGGDRDFNDLELTVQPTDPNSNISAAFQGKKEVIDLRDKPVDSLVSANLTVKSEAAFNNSVGFYAVNDVRGTITDPLTGRAIAPDEAGYAEAAVRQSVLDFDRNGTPVTNLPGGTMLAPYLITNGTPDTFLEQNADNTPNSNNPAATPLAYFAYLGANPDRVDHVRLLGDNTFGFEDLFQGGDFDCNDMVVKMNIA